MTKLGKRHFPRFRSIWINLMDNKYNYCLNSRHLSLLLHLPEKVNTCVKCGNFKRTDCVKHKKGNHNRLGIIIITINNNNKNKTTIIITINNNKNNIMIIIINNNKNNNIIITMKNESY